MARLLCTITDRFGSWNNAKRAAGLETNVGKYTDGEVLEIIETIHDRCGVVTTDEVRESEDITERAVSDHFGCVGRAITESNIQSDKYRICDDCSGSFYHLGKHIAQSNCDYPDISDRKKEIIVGVLMGDGYINECVNESTFGVTMVAENFIYWLKEELGDIMSEVSIENYDDKQDQYSITTISHPWFSELREWYSSGQKRFPDVDLTPTVLKMWYVTDGTMSNGYPNFSTVNELDREHHIMSLFKGLPFGVRWTGRTDAVYVEPNSIDNFFDYIGDPPPGFEYKWPDRNL